MEFTVTVVVYLEVNRTIEEYVADRGLFAIVELTIAPRQIYTISPLGVYILIELSSL